MYFNKILTKDCHQCGELIIQYVCLEKFLLNDLTLRGTEMRKAHYLTLYCQWDVLFNGSIRRFRQMDDPDIHWPLESLLL